MTDDVFDSDAFLQGVQAEGEMDTEFPKVPEGEYRAVIVNDEKHPMKASQFEYKEGDRAGEKGYMLGVWFKVDAPENEEAHEKHVRAGIFLDMEDDGRTMKTGKGDNVMLGRLRKATGTNEGQFQPFQLEGQSCLIKVKHQPDRNDPSIMRQQVSDFAPLD